MKKWGLILVGVGIVTVAVFKWLKTDSDWLKLHKEQFAEDSDTISGYELQSLLARSLLRPTEKGEA